MLIWIYVVWAFFDPQRATVFLLITAAMKYHLFLL
jgi:hypothetical protein